VHTAHLAAPCKPAAADFAPIETQTGVQKWKSAADRLSVISDRLSPTMKMSILCIAWHSSLDFASIRVYLAQRASSEVADVLSVVATLERSHGIPTWLGRAALNFSTSVLNCYESQRYLFGWVLLSSAFAFDLHGNRVISRGPHIAIRHLGHSNFHGVRTTRSGYQNRDRASSWRPAQDPESLMEFTNY